MLFAAVATGLKNIFEYGRLKIQDGQRLMSCDAIPSITSSVDLYMYTLINYSAQFGAVKFNCKKIKEGSKLARVSTENPSNDFGKYPKNGRLLC